MSDTTANTVIQPGGHVLDWLPLLACHVDPDGRVSYLNRNWSRFSGFEGRVAPFLWTDLIDSSEQSLPCRCPDKTEYCVQRHVTLRHHDGAPVQTDLHWQKLGMNEGGGWLLFGHPEADFPLLNAFSPRTTAPETGAAENPRTQVRGAHLPAGHAGLAAAGLASDSSAGSDPGGLTLPLSSPDILDAQRRATATHRLMRSPSDDAAGEDRSTGTVTGLSAEGRHEGATHDVLTGLPTWRHFEREAGRHFEHAAGSGENLGFLLVDIDYLGDLNDLYGRDIGDLVLRLVADRLTLLTAGEGLITRSGDDEFSVLVTGSVDAATLAAHAQALLSFVDLPVRIGTQQITFGLSIGASLYPRDGDSLGRLQHHALLAVNDVKARGRGGYRLFDPSMIRLGDGVTAQSNLIRGMLRDDLIYPAYQAKVSLIDGHIVGAEALMRWYRDGVVDCGPESFPEIFRSYDLATRVSARVQERVFQDIALWRRTGLEPPHISINVAPVEFMQDDYAEKLLARLDRFGLSARLIELELTEHVLYQNSEHYLHRALTVLRRAGMRITLDDFGTGYSSLSFLRDFPISSIKIDRSFVRQICTEPSMEVIVEAIIRFGEAVSVEVVAEGIETADQLAILQRIGCPIGQGYLFSPPVASSGFARLLSEGRSLIP
ncbi:MULTISPECIES: putative bifunctional diguanylate cyclase/phosphodiesterase [Asaia]|uniref:putative bifunctional diguanylate cyclase/phosphodiesterase n=1 Tax=Asaia TaxID=91914 RepID=UPI002554B00F|nr:bifunctional diguanylate cyclase/phosphodiesterase [Asaia sp. HumB]MDL2171641.1 bifunctional diguanylate cyclase/phosphodiesterase [Asaia sp. HumB]